MFITMLLFAVLLADEQVAPVVVPENVKAYFENLEAHRKHGLADAQQAVTKARNPAQKAQAVKRLKELKDSQSPGEHYIKLKVKPSVGDIGFVRSAKVIDVIDNKSALVRLSSSTQTFTGDRGVLRPSKPMTTTGEVIIRGVDFSKSADDTSIQLDQTFEVTGIDKDTFDSRTVIVEPFDAAKWRPAKAAK